jgi:DNA-binding transcriptional ArsR family regulator
MSETLSAVECAAQLRVLSEPERLRILQLLLLGPHTVSAVADVLDCSVALASHHLSVLKREAFLTSTKTGRQVFYELVPERFPQKTRHKPRVSLGCCEIQF